MIITELEQSHSEVSISQEKEVITKTHKVFLKIYLLFVFLAIILVRKYFLAKTLRERIFCLLESFFYKNFLTFLT